MELTNPIGGIFGLIFTTLLMGITGYMGSGWKYALIMGGTSAILYILMYLAIGVKWKKK